MPLALDDLFASPDHYLHSFDGDAAIFVLMDRAAYHRSIFLDGRIVPAAAGVERIKVATLMGALLPPLPTSWIFHIAHGGSTLLARALDDPAANLVLREPLALRQTAMSHDRARLPLVAAMAGKRYGSDAPTLVKANVPVNFMLADVIALDPSARALFLHCDLPDYLLAILKSDGHRAWLRRITDQLDTQLGDFSRSCDAERAAALWLAQTRAFAAAVARMPNARTIGSEAFFADPASVVPNAAEHLDIRMTHAAIDAVLGGPLFATHSKSPGVDFDNATRLLHRAELSGRIDGEIDVARGWIDRMAGTNGTGAERLKAVQLGA